MTIEERRLRERFPLPPDVEELIARIERESVRVMGGGCSRRKQRVLASLIVQNNMKRAVEIGVFAGSSLFPQAVAMRSTGGLVYAIDPYSPSHAQQDQNLERIVPSIGSDYAETTDWDGIFASVRSGLEKYGLASHANQIRKPSFEAADFIEPTIDMVHIDGNHDYDACARDIADFVPKVRSGGVVVLDDTAWDTIYPQYLELKESMQLIDEEYEDGESRPCWAALRKA